MYSENLSPAHDSQLIGTSIFEKRTVVELTENVMTEIEGGSYGNSLNPSSVCCMHGAIAVYNAIHDFFN